MHNVLRSTIRRIGSPFCPTLFHIRHNRPTCFLYVMSMSSNSSIVPHDTSREWTAEELALKEKAIAENLWTPVYRNRGFFFTWFVIRLHLVFFVVALSTLPLSMYQHLPIANSICIILFSSVLSVAIKKYLTRIIAVISVDTASRSIYRIGYPSFFAGRRNRFARYEDIVPLSSNKDSVRGVARLCFTDGQINDFLLLPTVNIELPDKKAAFILFGSALKHFDKDSVPSAAEEKRKKKVEKFLRLRMEEQSKALKLGEKREDETQKIEGG